MFVLVTYDVPAKRTELFRKLLARYLRHTQNSVFSGDLRESDYRKLCKEIEDLVINMDQIVLITCENRRNISMDLIHNGVKTTDDGHKAGLVI